MRPAIFDAAARRPGQSIQYASRIRHSREIPLPADRARVALFRGSL
jgi:hypothetical protein